MARRPSAKATAELSRPDHLRAKIVDLETFLASPDAKRNGAAYVAATRLAVTLVAELDELSKQKPPEAVDPTESMTDDELVGGIVAAISALPDVAVEAIEDAIAARRAGHGLRVIAGGEGEA